MKTYTIKGKSEKSEFKISIPADELLAFLQTALDEAEGEFDDKLATSAGGWPTAMFTALLPAKAREAAGWRMEDGWDMEKAMETFRSRLERKVGGGVTIESRQKVWDEKLALAMSYNMPREVFEKMNGKRPVEKAKKESGKAEVQAAIA